MKIYVFDKDRINETCTKFAVRTFGSEHESVVNVLSLCFDFCTMASSLHFKFYKFLISGIVNEILLIKKNKVLSIFLIKS